VRGDRLGLLNDTPVIEVSSNASGAERMTADVGLNFYKKCVVFEVNFSYWLSQAA
jgi:hypothetical protein